MATTTRRPPPPACPADPLERYALAARDAGCPRDQFERFGAAGVVLQPRQLAFAAACRECDHPDGPTEVGYGGARGGGKSHVGLAQMAVDDAQRFPGYKGLVLRKVGRAAREAFEDLRLKLLRRVPHDYARQDGVIRFENGSRLYLGHFKDERDIDAYLGLEYDGALIEEATTLSKSKVDGIRSVVRSSKPGWRPRIYFTTNPGGIGHAWFKARFVRPARGDDGSHSATTRFLPATVRDNRFVNPEYRRTLEGLTGWLRRAWLDGDWDIAAGQFFTNFRRDVHVLEPDRVPTPVPPGWRAWLGFDYGWTHYTTCHLFAESGDGDLYALAEHAERGWLPERHAAAIHAMLARHGVHPGRLMGVYAGSDVFARRPDGNTVADAYDRLGLPLTAANTDRINGAAEILRRLGDPDAGIPPRLYLSPSCARLVECLPAMEHDPHRPEDVLKTDTDADGVGGDDAYDSARYAIMAAATGPAFDLSGINERRR